MSTGWIVIRGSGIAAFALLSASVIWGLLMTTKLLGRFARPKALTWFHESLGIGALIATLVHIGVLSAHDYLDFTWTEILVPGMSDWRRLPVAFGTVALYSLTIVVGSFYVRRWIGQRVWRAIHFGSIGVFVAALIHGIQAGTDTANPVVMGLYIGAAVVVFALIAHRLIPAPTAAPAPD